MIQHIERFVQQKLSHDTTGHDWYHIDRVRKMSIHIAKNENVNIEIVEITALLHDILDDKLVNNKEEAKREIIDLLESLQYQDDYIQQIIYIIENVGFKGGNGMQMDLVEGKIIQDADRLDAIGAIGIARTFMYSGAKGQAMYDPNIPVRDEMSYEQYRNEKSTAINHFYEKLVKLIHTLHTDTAKNIAKERHEFLKLFLSEFHREWEVKL
ncbi:HD domain-containing protein [Sutcliffiella cohnii]